MSDQVLDQRFEALLRQALKAEGASLPMRVTADQVIDRHIARRAGSGFLGRVQVNRFAVQLGAVAVLIAAAFGVGIWVSRSNEIGPQPSPTPSASPAQAVAPTVEPTRLPSEQPTSRPEPTGPPHTHETIAAGPGFVAVGAYDDLDRQADIWTSPDGRTWTRVPSEQLGPGVVNDVTIGGPGLVAVGAGGRVGGSYRAAVWTSVDGLTWTRYSDGPHFGFAAMHGVTAGGPGIVAVGYNNHAWFSADGLTWNLATVPLAPGRSCVPWPCGPMHMVDVAAAGGRFVAVGNNWDTERPVIWTSADGMAWTDVPLDPEIFPAGTNFADYGGVLTGGPDGFTLTRSNQDVTESWTSSDGLSWLQATP